MSTCPTYEICLVFFSFKPLGRTETFGCHPHCDDGDGGGGGVTRGVCLRPASLQPSLFHLSLLDLWGNSETCYFRASLWKQG